MVKESAGTFGRAHFKKYVLLQVPFQRVGYVELDKSASSRRLEKILH